jgi:hypothetical protein
MEELVAACLKEEVFDTVTLTPRSGDGGVDVIAVKNGIGSLKLLGSAKAYKPGHIVSYDAIRSLLGVVSGDPAASKGIITTTSSFPPLVMKDKLIAQELSLKVGDGGIGWHIKALLTRRSSRREKDMPHDEGYGCRVSRARRVFARPADGFAPAGRTPVDRAGG